MPRLRHTILLGSYDVVAVAFRGADRLVYAVRLPASSTTSVGRRSRVGKVAQNGWEDFLTINTGCQNTLHVFHDKYVWLNNREHFQVLLVQEVPAIIFWTIVGNTFVT